MIYNLVQYLRNNLTETIYVNQRIKINGKVEDRNILVSDSGGSIRGRTEFCEARIQILTRDIDNVKAKVLSESVYALLHDRYGLQLPAVTIDGAVNPAIRTGHITCFSLPSTLGADDKGLQEYTSNYLIIYQRIK